MLLDLRETQNSYIIRVIFFLVVGAMLFGSVFSAFMGNSNPILLKSSVGEIRRKDLFSRGQAWAAIFQYLNTQDRQEVPSLLNQYLLPKIYQDFFTHYQFAMSDRLAWNLFLQRFQNETFSQEKIQALNQAIHQQYGSKSEFLKQLKIQLYTIALQEALYSIGQPLSPDFDIQHQAEKLQRHTHIYTYMPEDFYQALLTPSTEELQDFYQKHLDNYILSTSMDLEYYLLTPAQLLLPERDSEQYQQIEADLKARGYDEVTPALIQQSLYHKIIDIVNEQQVDLSSAELRALLEKHGVAAHHIALKELNNMMEDDLDDLFEQPGLYSVSYNSYTAYHKALQHYPLAEDQELFLCVKNHDAGGPQDFETVAYQVAQDWKKEQAFILALQQAQSDYQAYCQNQDLSILQHYHHHKELVVTDLFSDSRLNNEMKVALATLYDPRLDAEKSVKILAAPDSDHISVIFLTDLSIKQEKNDESDALAQKSFNLDDFAQKELLHKIVDTNVSQKFSYQIVSPEFWSFVERS